MAMGNRGPIAAHTQNLLLPDSPTATGPALEIGSGSGAQLELLAETFPQLQWRPSEYLPGESVVRGFYEQGPDGPDHGHPTVKVRTLAELDAVLCHKLSNVLPAVSLDGSAPWSSWPAAITESGIGSYAVVFCSNVVHISPWGVAEGIFAGAAAALRPGGSLVFHGPYKIDGKCVNDATQLWDAQMRGIDDGTGFVRPGASEGWGVREVSAMAAEGAKHGLLHVATEHPVGPAQNYLLQFVKGSAETETETKLG
jgi:hypothetical protein